MPNRHASPRWGPTSRADLQFREALDHLRDCCGIYSAVRNAQGQIVDFRIEYVNEAACCNNGLIREEQLGKRLSDILPSHVRTGLFGAYCRVVDTGQPFIRDQFEYRDAYGGSVETRYYAIQATKYGDGFFASWRNVTERVDGFQPLASATPRALLRLQETMEALRRERDRAQQYLDVASVMMIGLDREGNVVLANARACQILGYPEGEILGKEWFEHFLPERYRIDVRNVFQQIVAGNRSAVQYYENPVLTASGEERIIDWHNADVRDETGQVIGTLGSGMDITERKRAEDALRDSEARFRAIFEQVAVGMAQWRPDGRWLSANQRLCEILGYSRKELMQKTFQETTHRDDLEAIFDLARRLTTGEIPTYSIEKRYIRKDGSPVWVHLTISPLYSASGQVDSYIGVIQDIHARKEAEHAVRESEAFARSVFASPIAQIAVLDREGKILAVNPAWEQFALENGAPNTARIGVGANYVDVCRAAAAEGEETARQALAGLRAVLDGRMNVFTLEYPCHSPSRERWFQMTVTPSQTEARGLVVSHISITERKQTENALRASEERLRAIVTTAADAIVTIDESGIIESFNPAAERMFGYAADEVIGRNVRHLMSSPHADKHGEYLSRYLQTGEARIIGIGREVTARRKDGSIFPVDLAISQIDHLGLFTGILRDISERKRLQEEVLRAAEEEQRRIGQELHDDAQQQLTGLAMLAQSIALMLSETSGTSSEGRTLADRAAYLARGINGVNRHVHLLSRGLVPAEIDSHGLPAALAQLARNTSELYPIHCRFQGDESIDVRDNFVATHLYRIAQEALTNAVKHSQATEVLLTIGRVEGGIRLQVQDNGIGIPAESSADRGRGVQIMRYRAGLIGAEFGIGLASAAGTEVTCALPDAAC